MSQYTKILIKIMEDIQNGKANFLKNISKNYLRDISIIRMLIRGKTLFYVGKQNNIGVERVMQIRNQYIKFYKQKLEIKWGELECDCEGGGK